ncbi:MULTISPECIES: VCBS repeat-containing protein [unclassified Streptomyces]|uniref:VCBS repeat-containing protein n=1 Tax=Streptomyces sp. NPDC007872 TaxID=3364782 RepID=UPI0036890466
MAWPASAVLPVMPAVALTGTPAAAAADESQTPDVRFEKTAFAEAKRTGKRVEILDRRQEATEFFANPDGSTTRRSYGEPKWTRAEGRWRPVDASLVKKDDGSVGPASPVFPIAFSGGGAQPLATMVKDGKELSLTWPTVLPAPVVEGDTATYRSVLPGVDLKLIAEVDGFAQHLVVQNAEAAANPALRTIKLGFKTDGVTLTEGPGDKLLAKDEKGATVFSAPGPKMWEQPAAASEDKPAATSKAKASSAAGADVTAAQPDSAPVAADVSGSTLTLTPDAKLLAAADQFPLVIDPVFSGGYREKWAVVYSATPSATYPNGSGWNSSNPADEPRVGYNGTGDTASFFAMNTNGLANATILDAKFAVVQTHSYECSASTVGPTELWSAGGIENTPSWSTAPWAAKLDYASFYGGNDQFCPGDKGHDFTSPALKAYVQKAADNGWGTLVLGMRAPSGYSGNTAAYKRFRNNPVLEVDYNYKPVVDGHAAYEGSWTPSGDGNKAVPCATAIGNSGIALTAKVRDPDGGSVDAVFTVKNSSGSAVTFSPNASTKRVTSGQWASVTMPAKNLTNGTYTWTVYAKDNENTTSPTTAACSFTVDRIGPNKPVSVYDVKDGSLAGQETDKYPARKSVQLKFGNTVSDVVGYCWAMDHFVSTASTRCANGNWVAAGSDAANSATVTVTPSGYPSSTLYVLAYDAAGNHSPMDGGDETVVLPTEKAEFVYEAGVTPVTPGTYPRDRHGDLNGDGQSDFVATNPDGELLLYRGNGTLGEPAAASLIGTGGWGGALIAHRDDLQGLAGPTAAPDGYEDFLVRLSNNRLYLYPGNGLGSPWVYSRQEIAHPSQDDWRGLRQVMLPGDIDGKPGNDLVTIECLWDTSKPTPNCVNAELLLYSGNAIAGGGQDQNEPFDLAHPSVIGIGGWRDFTNLAMDDLNGDGAADIVGRNPGDGKLHLYPGCLNRPECASGYKLGSPTVYGTGGWTQRPYLTSPGNIQGTVKSTSVTVNDEGQTKTYAFKQFVPTPGEEYGDFWATTPADPNTAVPYMNESGIMTSRVCPTGCLLTYPGGPTSDRTPRLSGTGSWATLITGIF